MSFSATFEPGKQIEAHHWVIVAVGRGLLTEGSDGRLLHCFEQIQELQLPVAQMVHVGLWQGQSCFAIELDAEPETVQMHGFQVTGLRGQLHALDYSQFALAGRAMQLLHWRNYHRFCGFCGARTQPLESERVLQCPSCESFFYPKIAPCVIGVIARGDCCLLARNANFPDGLYSAIAGFIEPGETAETALKREIWEEVGVEVGQLEYLGSQSWPFPSQLMLGFIAHYSGGEIRVDGEEIVQAGWFSQNTLPQIPPSQTIAGMLIRSFFERISAAEVDGTDTLERG